MTTFTAMQATWAEYWKAEGVWAAGDTTSSDTADSHGEKIKVPLML